MIEDDTKELVVEDPLYMAFVGDQIILDPALEDRLRPIVP